MARLASDFRTGEVMWEDATEARWQLEKAIAQQQALRMRNIRTEKKLIAAGDFLSDRLGLAYQQAAAKVEKPKVSELAVQAEAYPPVVSEGQEVTINVKVLGPNIAKRQSEAHPVEIRVAGITSLAKNQKVPSAKMDDVVSDADYICGFVDDLVKSGNTFNAVRIDYDVTVRGDDGKMLDRQQVSVVLAGAEQSPARSPITLDGCPAPEDAVYSEGPARGGKRVGYKNRNDRWVGPYFQYYDSWDGKSSHLAHKGCLAETSDGYTTHRGPFIGFASGGWKQMTATVLEGDPMSTSGRVKYEGPVRYWNKKGEITQETNYSKGLRDGPYILWDQKTGLKEQETHYRNDLKNGFYRSWRGNIKIVEGQYRNNKRHGTWRYWNHKSGKLGLVREYRDDKILKQKYYK